MDKSVAVIIINWNALKWTEACLEQLKKQEYQNFRVFVVDNNSNNGEGKVLEENWGDFSRILKVRSNLGFAEGNNYALSHEELTNFDYYLLLNNDTRFSPKLLSELVEVDSSRNSIVGPIVRSWGAESIQSAGVKNINLWTGSTHLQRTAPTSKKSTENVEMVSGCCFMIGSNILKKVGNLDPDYFAYYEETDFCLRALQAGFSVLLAANVEIEHFGGGSSSGVSNFQERQLLKNRLLLVKKNGSLLQKISITLYVSLFYLWMRCIIVVLRGKTSIIPALLSGYREGISYMFKINT